MKEDGSFHPFVVRLMGPGFQVDSGGVNNTEWLGDYTTLDEARVFAPNRAKGLSTRVAIVQYTNGRPTLIETYGTDGVRET